MSVLTFDKNSLGNLEYSLQREMLSTNRAGGYMNTTIVCCNTRKYHGLVVCPKPDSEDEENYVLLSSLDESITHEGQVFNLAIHRFSGIYDPRGHKYITDFKYTPTPTITYRVGSVIIKKELLWLHSNTQLLIRYTVIDAPGAIRLKLRPFLAFRNVHTVTQANVFADGHSYPVTGGMKHRLYEDFPWLHIQASRKAEFVPAPDWYYGFVYLEEKYRGYPYKEDLLTPGYFELTLKKDDSIIVSVGTSEADPKKLKKQFDTEISRRSNKIDFLSCLRHSARQFVVKHGDRTEVVAGFPWFGRWGRDTFISLPGITLTQGRVESCGAVLDTMVSQMKDGLFPNMGSAYNSADAPMWFFWTVQQYEKHVGRKVVWEKYGKVMKTIIKAYIAGIGDAIRVDDSGLVWAAKEGHALTWMDAIVEEEPVTPRAGYAVEINALWYNALMYFADLSEELGVKADAKKYSKLAKQVSASFIDKFWLDKNYLADYVDESGPNKFVRPNQIIACSLPYVMLMPGQILSVIELMNKHLLTPKGLRTLSPQNPLYEGHYEGDQPTRDRQYHQGTVWPWLLEHFVKANFDIHGKGFLAKAKYILEGFDDDISTYGIGSIAEIYDGDPPHAPKGAISQAWSVGAVLRINEMIEQYEKE